MADIALWQIAVIAPAANAGAPGTTVLVTTPVSVDMFDGGGRQISGVVTVQGAPAQIAYRVLLMEQRSKRIVRETWSTPGTGVYTFDYIKQGIYTTMVFDHTGTYDPEAKSDLVAVPM